MTDTPKLHQNSQTLSLSLDTSLIQSCMLRDKPTELVLDYTRTMMGFLMLNPAPRHILMIGLGGGSIPKYCHAYLPDAQVTVVEINQAVIDLRDEFAIPRDDDRFQIICADGAEFVKNPSQRYDIIMVDGYDGTGLPDVLCTRAFYQRCADALSEQGLLVLNLQADTAQCRQITARLNKLFHGGVIMVESDEGGNEIVVAGSRATMATAQSRVSGQWDTLHTEHQQTLAVCSTRFERALKRLNLSGP